MSLRLLKAAAAGVSAGLLPDLQLLQWNPHWQCTVWNTNNCSLEAGDALTRILESSDIDFANLIEYENPDYALPENWTAIPSNRSCGRDYLELIYNNVRWAPVEGGASAKVCMQPQPPDRPFVLQEFESTNSSERLIVIGAHFPHPPGLHDTSLVEVTMLRIALEKVLGTAEVRRVVLIADTNEFSSTSSQRLFEFMGVPGRVVSTALEPSCCYDNHFAAYTTFDRIIANFGAEMETKMLFSDPLPEWAKEYDNTTGRRGAFHKAILGTLRMQGTTDRLITYIFSGFIFVLAAAAAFVLVAVLRAGRSRRGEEGTGREALKQDDDHEGSADQAEE